jgi:phytoene dehydrogenase-like protein
MDEPDIVVVGGGIAGLAAAAEAARAGRRVLVLESAPELGGRARTTEHQGYHLNLGPRALYKAGGLRRLGRLGVRPQGGGPAQAMALIGGEVVRGFADMAGLLTTPLLGPRDRASVAALLATARHDRRLAGRPATEWLRGKLRSDRALDVALALVRLTTYVGAPDTISADAVSAHLALARWGVIYVNGGWRFLADGLAMAARRHGAQLRTGSRVIGVEPGRRVRLTLHDGTVTARSAVLAGLSPHEVRRLLPGSPGASGSPLFASCLDVALARLPAPEQSFIVGIDTPVYLSAQWATVRPAPDGGAVVHALRYHGHGAQPAQEHRAELTQLLDDVQPGWRDVVVHQRFLPRMMVCAGLPEPAAGGLAGRPGACVATRDGIFLAGDWIGHHGLLAEASLASAREAARAAVRHTG